MDPLRELVESREFLAGLGAGTVALGITFMAAAALRHARPRRGTRPGLLGGAFVVAAAVAIGGWLGLRPIWPVSARVALALVLLGLAGEIAARTRAPGLVGAVLAIPAATLLVDSAARFPTWVVVVLVVGTARFGATTADLDRRGARLGIGPLLLLVSLGGLYLTVPDTELARAAVGAALPLGLLAWPRAQARLGSGGSYAAIGLFLWIATLEGDARPGSIVGATASLMLLVGEPAGRAVAGRLAEARRTRSARPGALVAAQIGLVAYASRVAGLRASATAAFVLVLPALLLAMLAGAWLSVPDPRAGPSVHAGDEQG